VTSDMVTTSILLLASDIMIASSPAQR
jgi:hypothetical protein